MPEPEADLTGARITVRELVHKSRELESRAPVQDPGIFQIDSQVGEFLMVNADKLQAQAEEKMRDQHFQKAVDKYSEAILDAIQVRNNCIQQGMLFYGRSRAHYQLEHYELAIKDSAMVVACLPFYEKGKIHFLQTLYKLELYGQALPLLREAFSRPLNHRSKIEYLTLAVQIHTHLKDPAAVLKYYALPTAVWRDVVQKLVLERSWDGLILLLNCADTRQYVTELGDQEINLSDIIFSSLAVWKSGAQDLVLALLKAGASHKSVCPQMKQPVHTALKVATKTESYELFDYLLEHIEDDELEACDDEGTLLHLVCRSKITQSKRRVIIERLLKTDLDPTARNSAGKKAHELLPASDPDVQYIRKHIELKGYEANGKSTGTGLPAEGPAVRSPCERWDRIKVQQWFIQQNLASLAHKFREFEGLMLLELRTMLDRAPAVYIRLLGTSLGLGPPEILALSAALRTLPD